MSAAPDSSYRRAIDAVASQLVEPQLRFIADRGRMRIACTSRQCGKNFAVTRLLVLRALERPGREIVYVNDTYKNARDVMWIATADGLPAVCRELGVAHRLNHSTLTVAFANGSYVQLMGADRGAWAALRGRRLDMIVADEMQRYDDGGLRAALARVIPDCLMARAGSFVGIGTPDEFCVGKFHDICEDVPDPETGVGQRTGWSVHHWTAEDLDGVTSTWREQLAWAEQMGIDTATDPDWQREKLGRWVKNDRSLIHVLGPAAVWDGELPAAVRTRCERHRGAWHCVCPVPSVPRRSPQLVYAGLDFGYHPDPMAIAVGGISDEEGALRELWSEKRAGLDLKQVAEWVRELVDRFGIVRIYGDSASAQQIATLRDVYGLPIEAAVKREDDENDANFWHAEREAALRYGSLQVRRGSPLHDELLRLVRDPKLLLRKMVRAAPGQDDHCYDAWRYLFRMVRVRHVQRPERPLDPDEAKLASIREQMARRSGPMDDGRHRTAGHRR